MCRRPWIWLVVGVLLLAVCSRWGSRRLTPLAGQLPRPGPGENHSQTAGLPSQANQAQPGLTFSNTAAWKPAPLDPRFPYRLANTTNSLRQLVGNDKAILLQNALLDTDRSLDLPIPDPLRAGSDPGSYIVQARAPLDSAFRSLLRDAGASIVSYIPNNAYLVQASAQAAAQIAAAPQTQAVLPYHPYFKLSPALLSVLFDSQSSSTTDQSSSLPLNLLLFPNAPADTSSVLASLGIQILSEQPSPFGPLLSVRSPTASLAPLAALPVVQALEPARTRISANDLSRVALGVAPNLWSSTNYLGLTGSNILVNVNDSGVDGNQPDLLGRVLFDALVSGTDTNGHGTHVAGIIAGSGAQSLSVSNVPGSGQTPAAFQFRGKAPGAKIFAISMGNAIMPTLATDSYLQQTAARTNAAISNNSWNYADDNQYDLAAASFDAAVRDALPNMPAAQPLLCVFAAGNAGHGNDNGAGGAPDRIQSPGTAKNVITVGAVEQARFISNETWTCSSTGCRTNMPWLGMTDNSNQIAAFSSRGNVGIGTEGDFGRFKPDVVAPGTFILSTRSTQWDEWAYYSHTNDWFGQLPDTNYSEVLSDLNETVAPVYRFESGTSLAAAAVSGTLALMEEFFQQRLGLTNSPALMKALLINGAQPLPNSYGLQVQGTTNFQGWGQLNLPNSLPLSLTNLSSATNGIFVFDQDPAPALATGQSKSRFLSLNPAARYQPLRITLVWTDPPGNPVASLKLVNNLNLVVTNLDTGEVFFGNDILPGSSYNQAWNSNAPPGFDLVNNVQNVLLPPSLGTNYSVTVIGRRVNVNAVTAQPGAVLQDYALVITSGNGQSQDALTISDRAIAGAMPPPIVSILTNSFLSDPNNTGAILLQQRVGAEAPFAATNSIPLPGPLTNAWLTIGDSNQWHFYVVTNDSGFTNAAFFTFLPQTLSAGHISTLPTAGPFLTNATRLEADIDLYVSLSPALTNLDPAAISAADKSLMRGGAEMIIYTNALPSVYFVGVKSESQEAAEYAFEAVFSQLPFSEADAQNNQLLRGFAAPTPVPGGTAARAGQAWIFGLAPVPLSVRRVIVTNTISAPSLGDLVGTLAHNNSSVVLNNHSTNGLVLNQSFVYDDSGEGDVPGGQSPDGPGSLHQFAGQPGLGQWRLNLADTNLAATDDSLSVFLEAQPDLTTGISPTLFPGACRQDYLYLPLAITNLTAAAMLLSGQGPVSLQICPVDLPPGNCPSLQLTTNNNNGTIVLDITSHPSLNPGLYVFRSCNLGPAPASVSIIAVLGQAANPPSPLRFASTSSVPILDDAVSTSSVFVTNLNPILSAAVGVRLDHPRVSDLVLSLLSPDGTRVLLDENRGGASTNGMGLNIVMTNIASVPYSGGPEAVTNNFDVGLTSGTVTISYDMYSLPDDMRVYYESNLIFDSGLVSGSNSVTLNFGPGTSTIVSVVMNDGGNANSNTAWYFRLTSTRLEPLDLTFTENTNLTTTPIKFAPTPLTNINFTSLVAPTNGIFYLPEESLDRLMGHSPAGQWRLEIADTRAGATNPPPRLLNWQLFLWLKNTIPPPVVIGPAQPWTNLLAPGQVQWFAVATPLWISFATNTLLSASAPVSLLFNQTTPPTGTNAGDAFLLSNVISGSRVLQTNGSPPLSPGSVYYLGVQNTNATTVLFGLEVNFDVPGVTTLLSGVLYPNANPGPPSGPDYYRYVVSTNAVRAQFEIDSPSAPMTLVARKGLPLPGLSSYDYFSANPGTNEELIVLFNYSTPVALSPGEWYLAAINVSGGPVTYSVMATEFPAYGTNLLITGETATPTNFCLTWSSLPGVHYFVQGKANILDAHWSTVSPTILANDYAANWCLILPSRFHFFRVSEGLVLGYPPPSISSVKWSTNGCLLQWSALANERFIVQWTPSLVPPAWLPFTNLVASTNSLFWFLDNGSQSGGLGPARFYRLGQLPSR